MKFADVKAHLNARRMNIRKADGEYRVTASSTRMPSAKDREAIAYYTPWLDDAWRTGLEMAEQLDREAGEGR